MNDGADDRVERLGGAKALGDVMAYQERGKKIWEATLRGSEKANKNIERLALCPTRLTGTSLGGSFRII